MARMQQMNTEIYKHCDCNLMNIIAHVGTFSSVEG